MCLHGHRQLCLPARDPDAHVGANYGSKEWHNDVLQEVKLSTGHGKVQGVVWWHLAQTAPSVVKVDVLLGQHASADA